ncbi:tyrosine-type recombinase/integrase [Kribbella qitaiheensis]|uniref:Tyrosine-type recombinase/integrase n=1 Tax=Kribbella qitaiheensis TaxID=1544730 RepID=A0A7G6X5S3_9ACTN|nr:tyrosine-type recombinase/integrase [Kribbella qitaiheensis]
MCHGLKRGSRHESAIPSSGTGNQCSCWSIAISTATKPSSADSFVGRLPQVVADAGLPKGFTFHDLRHTGNHLASRSGASTKKLMGRMGHSTMRAALIYQHATDERAC